MSRRLCRQPMPDSIGLKICTGTGLRVCRICIGPGRLPPLTHRHGVPSQGGFEQRSAHTFAEMVRAFVGEEKVTVSAKARFQGRSASAHILRPRVCLGSHLRRDWAHPVPHLHTRRGSARSLRTCIRQPGFGAHLACSAANAKQTKAYLGGSAALIVSLFRAVLRGMRSQLMLRSSAEAEDVVSPLRLLRAHTASATTARPGDGRRTRLLGDMCVAPCCPPLSS